MVHAVLILLSAVLAVLFGVWCLAQYWRQDGVVSLFAAIAAFAVRAVWSSTIRGSCARRGRCDDRLAARIRDRLSMTAAAA
jgi:hypothetical protein